MISEDGPFTVPAVLAKMGDLSQERIIAKHAARQSLVCLQHFLSASSGAELWQALSTTRTVQRKVKVSRNLDDVRRNSKYDSSSSRSYVILHN